MCEVVFRPRTFARASSKSRPCITEIPVQFLLRSRKPNMIWACLQGLRRSEALRQGAAVASLLENLEGEDLKLQRDG